MKKKIVRAVRGGKSTAAQRRKMANARAARGQRQNQPMTVEDLIASAEAACPPPAEIWEQD